MGLELQLCKYDKCKGIKVKHMPPTTESIIYCVTIWLNLCGKILNGVHYLQDQLIRYGNQFLSERCLPWSTLKTDQKSETNQKTQTNIRIKNIILPYPLAQQSPECCA